MAYAGLQELIERYGRDELLQLTDRERSGEIDAAAVGRALDDAEAEINGYLAGRYALPLAETPAIVQRLACEIAFHLLMGDRSQDANRKRYEDARALLKSIAKGEVQLGVAGTQVTPVAQTGLRVNAPKRLFGRDVLERY